MQITFKNFCKLVKQTKKIENCSSHGLVMIKHCLGVKLSLTTSLTLLYRRNARSYSYNWREQIIHSRIIHSQRKIVFDSWKLQVKIGCRPFRYLNGFVKEDKKRFQVIANDPFFKKSGCSLADLLLTGRATGHSLFLNRIGVLPVGVIWFVVSLPEHNITCLFRDRTLRPSRRVFVIGAR